MVEMMGRKQRGSDPMKRAAKRAAQRAALARGAQMNPRRTALVRSPIGPAEGAGTPYQFDGESA